MADASQFLFIPYQYVVISAALGGSAQQIVPLLLDQDADFELHEIFGSSTLDGAADIRPNNFTVQISDKTNGRNWSDNQVPQRILARSDGGWVLSRPVLLAKRSNMAFNIVNLSADANTVTIVLSGVKVLQYSS